MTGKNQGYQEHILTIMKANDDLKLTYFNYLKGQQNASLQLSKDKNTHTNISSHTICLNQRQAILEIAKRSRVMSRVDVTS